jgi:hypothetical protein
MNQLKPIVKIGDKVLRRSTSRDEEDSPNPWVETTVNETYLSLIHEFPEDYRSLDGAELSLCI